MIKTNNGTFRNCRDAIDAEWETPHGYVDWLGMERVLVRALREGNIGHAKEAIDAFTHRGHFAEHEYEVPHNPPTSH